MRTRQIVATAAFLILASQARAAEPPRKEGQPPAWLAEELPLPMTVRTPADLALKAVAERQYLIFNLIAAGKLAWDRGDFATAAAKWEALLRVPSLDVEIDRVVRPLVTDARARAGSKAGPLPASPFPPDASNSPGKTAAPVVERVSVSGTVTGGGALGPGGTVLWLKRTDGSTPRPAPSRNKVMNQMNKTFVPRVLPVTVGSKVEFRNQDDIFHNVFSLSKPNDFDAGLYKGGQSYERSFTATGPVQVLCNIHASMIGYVVVVDTPYFAQADASGAFSIRGLPPGEYTLEAWHESASNVSKMRLTVGPGGVRGVAVKIGADKRNTSFVPDKYGKPRQAQLGY